MILFLIPEVADLHIFVHIILFNCRLLAEEMIKWPLRQSLKLEMIHVGCSLQMSSFLSYWGRLTDQITSFNLKFTGWEMMQAISRG